MQQEKQQADIEEGRLNGASTLAGETYTALAHKVEEEIITSLNTGSGVRMASRQAVPESPSGRSNLIIVAAAFLLGVFLSVLVVIVVICQRA